MQPLLLRDETPPDDIVVVVRGGESDQLSSAGLRCGRTRSTESSLSQFFAAFDVDVETLCRSVSDLSRYGNVRTSTFGVIRTAGFALIPTLLRPHFDIVLPDLEEASLERLESCFDDPFPNPGRQPASYP